jgi:hypothetical protein
MVGVWLGTHGMRGLAPRHGLFWIKGGGEIMPLDWEKYHPWVKNAFWILVFVIAFVAMQKAMHPGWTIMGF